MARIGRSFPTHSKLLPPVVVLPLATLGMQTIQAHNVAVKTARTRAAVRTQVVRPTPAKIQLGFPTADQTTVQVTLADQRSLNRLKRQAHSTLKPPVVTLPRLSPQSVQTRLLPPPRGDGRRNPHSKLQPPTVTFALPSRQQQTITSVLAGRTRLEQQRHGPHSALAPPAVVSTAQTVSSPQLETISVTLAHRRRVGAWNLDPPAALITPAPPIGSISVTIAERPRIETQRRAPHSQLFPPAVVTGAQAPIVVPPQPFLEVVRPPRKRVGAWRQPPPVVVGPHATIPTTIVTVLAGRKPRFEQVRRLPRSHLAGPSTADQPVANVQTQLASKRRKGQWRLKPPAYVSYYTPFVPPPPVPPPAPAVTQILQPQGLRHQRRTQDWRFWVEHGVFSPAVVNPAAPPTQQQQTISVALAHPPQQARQPHPRVLATPVVNPLPTQQQQTIGTQLAVRTRLEQPRHRPVVKVEPPIVVRGFPTQQQLTIGVALAGRNRLERTRHPSHVVLLPPQIILPLPTLSQEIIHEIVVAVPLEREWWRHRHYTSYLKPPVVVTQPTVTPQRLRMLRGLGL